MRAARLALADFMCEFRPIVSEWDHKLGYAYGDRCCSNKHLEVHHGSYVQILEQKSLKTCKCSVATTIW
jgi:hypothetical protein